MIVNRFDLWGVYFGFQFFVNSGNGGLREATHSYSTFKKRLKLYHLAAILFLLQNLRMLGKVTSSGCNTEINEATKYKSAFYVKADFKPRFIPDDFMDI